MKALIVAVMLAIPSIAIAGGTIFDGPTATIIHGPDGGIIHKRADGSVYGKVGDVRFDQRIDSSGISVTTTTRDKPLFKDPFKNTRYTPRGVGRERTVITLPDGTQIEPKKRDW